MHRLAILAVCIVASMFVLPTFAKEWIETPRWDSHFTQRQAQGVMVLWNENKQQGLTNSLQRANQGYLPASTFKIPNSLISLELGVVKDEFQVFKWDGKKRDILTWNHDQTMITAMKYSVVPVYQDFARQIGEKRMSKMIASFGYGNENISGDLESFWLDGDIRISATEQINFLRRLYHNKINVSERSQRIVKKAMLTEANGDYIIRAKTGYAVRAKTGIGWWVGWVELDDNVWFFAMNIDIPTSNSLPFRQAITKEILTQEGIIS
ncbi:class D beta-lactamase [Shewanella glacialimarina]|jgi:beta-lactamase class D|uniref:class D beta-lactamase n=1 Tax=Shewanella glacialimarina TaxID=2590884 RepID=UPI001CF86C5F|nr:class D beta-lactamase [Shewanella glacialimarina]UCX04085.1 class D beta-lactamase [Shewanella glacialimarina]